MTRAELSEEARCAWLLTKWAAKKLLFAGVCAAWLYVWLLNAVIR